MVDLMMFSVSLLGMIILSYLANLTIAQPSVSPLYRSSFTLITMTLFCLIALIGVLIVRQGDLSLGLGFIIPAVMALCFFSPAIRKQLARYLPIDPQHPVHTLALALSTIIVIDMWITLAEGLPSVNRHTSSSEMIEAARAVWIQDLLFALLALIGVGWLTRRSLRQSLKRLGIERLTWRQLIIAVLIAFLLALFSHGMQLFSEQTGFGNDPNADALNEKKLGALSHHLLGWISLSLGGAIGEEALFRGALQPRFGLLLTSLLFTFTHTTYGLTTGTFVVWIGGLVLGLTQKRYHLLVTMIVHAMYNLLITIFDHLF